MKFIWYINKSFVFMLVCIPEHGLTPSDHAHKNS